MRRSTLPARLITSVIALVLTPIALILLSIGGQTMNLTFFAYGFDGDFSPLIGPLCLQALAIALLVIVALTGIWSSAGLIIVGAFGIVPLLVALFPVTLTWIYRIAPIEWVDGLAYGVPLVLLPALGAMGLVIALVRRDPQPKGGALGALGLVAAPVLLAGGAWLVTWGVAEGTLSALRRFQFDVRPDAALAVVFGTLLIVAGVFVTRWSPFALLLPALAVLVAGIQLIAAPQVVVGSLGVLPQGMSMVLPSLMLYGGGAAAGLLYLTFTAVLLRVRAQSRLSMPAHPAGPVTSGGWHDPAAPFAASPSTQPTYPYPPAPGMSPAPQPYPPAPQPYPPAQQPYPPQPPAP